MCWREGGKNSEKDEGAERQRLGGRERRVRGTVHPHSSARQQPPLPGYSSPRAPARSQAWAIHKGRHLEGIDKEDPPTWKTRLRCALNKSADFCEVRERSQLDISDPYKVYRIVSGSAHGPVARTCAPPGKKNILRSRQEPPGDVTELVAHGTDQASCPASPCSLASSVTSALGALWHCRLSCPLLQLLPRHHPCLSCQLDLFLPLLHLYFHPQPHRPLPFASNGCGSTASCIRPVSSKFIPCPCHHSRLCPHLHHLCPHLCHLCPLISATCLHAYHLCLHVCHFCPHLHHVCPHLCHLCPLISATSIPMSVTSVLIFITSLPISITSVPTSVTSVPSSLPPLSPCLSPLFPSLSPLSPSLSLLSPSLSCLSPSLSPLSPHLCHLSPCLSLLSPSPSCLSPPLSPLSPHLCHLCPMSITSVSISVTSVPISIAYPHLYPFCTHLCHLCPHLYHVCPLPAHSVLTCLSLAR
ncbi:uncharacterized protein LOC125162207 isoform X2 [Prionailurus viverrinus]|uniref:uncharacterized protein LOC125162207 isoform X2 n=1 Tax=Prionailurus viverrinus TaxID=61388 RepID=UPI001FF4F8CC|nr:uncharacterized protein LOC125162207 isoform X2 [Prionailurus viverrinus]